MPRPSRSPLSTIAIKGQGARTETVPVPPETPTRIALTYRAPADRYEALRRISYEERRPIQEMLDEAVARWLDARTS
jgi:hypothetical protein